MEQVLTKRGGRDAGPEAVAAAPAWFFDRFPTFWRVQLAGWALYLLMIYVTFLTVAAPGTLYGLFRIKLIRTCIGFCLTCLMRAAYRRFGTDLPIQKVVPVVLGCSVVFGLAWTLAEMAAASLRSPAFSFAEGLPRVPRNSLDYGLTLTAWSALYFGVKYWRQWQAERERALAAAALADRAQLEALRYQINPHFLFNSLNSIRASIGEDADRARRMVTQLSEFLRYSLLHHGAAEVALGEEVEAVRNYLAIEQTRFEERLGVEFDIDGAAEGLPTPSFLLNPLVENAIKHGLKSQARPLRVRVSAKVEDGALVLEVANTGGLSDADGGTGVGLRNTRERLEKVYGGRGRLELFEEGGWVRARVTIS
ncbi:MAG TPA: histidine kinase [Pyrinomonadaceae bacterium]